MPFPARFQWGSPATFQVLLRFVNQGVSPDLSLLFPRWLAGSLEPNMKLYQFEWMESLNSNPHLPPMDSHWHMK
ncbi:MAG: hypothetical protein P8L18_12770 [Verrucomicrobiota bacterium]|nr:hypothetical protein [Verrucomicrobiota bacterium]